jgi:hypothetical protein
MKPFIRRCTDFLEQRNRSATSWNFKPMATNRRISLRSAIDNRRPFDPNAPPRPMPDLL